MPGQPAACAPVDSEALYGLYQHCRIPREHLYTQRRGPDRLSALDRVRDRCMQGASVYTILDTIQQQKKFDIPYIIS